MKGDVHGWPGDRQQINPIPTYQLLAFPQNRRILNIMKKLLVTILLLVAALYFYSVGLDKPALGFLVLGAIAEFTAWARYIKWPGWNATK